MDAIQANEAPAAFNYTHNHTHNHAHKHAKSNPTHQHNAAFRPADMATIYSGNGQSAAPQVMVEMFEDGQSPNAHPVFRHQHQHEHDLKAGYGHQKSSASRMNELLESELRTLTVHKR